MELSVIVPVYKEERNIPEFLRRIIPILEGITGDFEILFCLDPSPDRSEEVILEHHERDSRIKLLVFSRRFGQPMATLAGLKYSTGLAAVILDVDLQDPPELIVDMVARWREGFDVVMAQRRSRKGETLVKRIVSYLGYKAIARLSDVQIPPNTGDFRLLSRRVVDQINQLKESHGFLRGLVGAVGFKQTLIQFDRPPRFAGTGHYNRLLGSLRIGFNGLVGFSNNLLALSTLLGFVIAAFSFLIAAAYIVTKLCGLTLPWGNPTLVILIMFLGGVQLITTGILGEYIGRIYDEVKARPKFIVDRSAGFGPEATQVNHKPPRFV